MIKKIIFSLLCFIPVIVSASVTPLVRIGGRFYDTLEDAVNAAPNNSTLTLISNIDLKDTLDINKNITIDLNGNNITAKEKVFQVKGGFLTLSGKGTVKETEPNYGAIMLIGSSEPTNEKYSGVRVGKDVILEGWSGIFINHESGKSYGVNAYLEGKINAVNDTSGGTGIGIYINGNIKHTTNYPVINIGDNAKITSTGNGIYMAGYMELNVDGGYIQGDESGIGMKAGILNINDGTIISTGSDETPSQGNNNGINASGTAIQIESNPNYAGNMKINIKDGLIKSKNSYAVYEYIGKGETSLVNTINISSGQVESGKDNFYLSNSFNEKHPYFIEGGLYSSDPSDYLDPGYSAILNKDNLYEVNMATFRQVSKYEDESPRTLLYLLMVGLLVILSVIGFKYIKK